MKTKHFQEQKLQKSKVRAQVQKLCILLAVYPFTVLVEIKLRWPFQQYTLVDKIKRWKAFLHISLKIPHKTFTVDYHIVTVALFLKK